MKFNLTNSNQDRLYLFFIKFDSGMEVVKIGKSSGDSSVDRMLQIQRDYFMKYRYTFICYIKRDRVIEKDVFKYETALHKFFDEYRYKAPQHFDGSTELFVIDKEAAVDVYEYILEHGPDSLEGMEYNPEAYYKEDDPMPDWS